MINKIKTYQNQIPFPFLFLILFCSIPLLWLAISKDDEVDSLNHKDDDGDDPNASPLRNVGFISIND